MVRLGDICEIQSGGTPARSNSSYWDGGTIPWVKISDIRGKCLQNTEEFITENGLQNSSAKIFPKGTILYSIFATLGETCILDIDAATNQAIAGLTIKKQYRLLAERLLTHPIPGTASCAIPGSVTVSTLPSSELFSTQTRPAWSRAISHTSGRPSPAPPSSRLRDLSTRKNG